MKERDLQRLKEKRAIVKQLKDRLREYEAIIKQHEEELLVLERKYYERHGKESDN